MAQSGVKMCDDAVNNFKDKKLHKKGAITVYKIVDRRNDDGKLEKVIAEVKNKDDKDWPQDWEEFRQELKDEPMYILYDFPYSGGETAKSDQLVLVYWCPDSCLAKDRMLYASSKQAITRALKGIQCHIHASELCETSQEAIESRIKGSKTVT